MQTSTQTMTTTSSLLGLPAELRNRIYRLCLVHEDKRIDLTGLTRPRESEPALLAACTQVRNEGLSIFCAENRFKICIPQSIMNNDWAIWFETLTPKYCSFFTHIDIEYFPCAADTVEGLKIFRQKIAPKDYALFHKTHNGGEGAREQLVREAIRQLAATIQLGIRAEAIHFEIGDGLHTLRARRSVTDYAVRAIDWRNRRWFKVAVDVIKDELIREAAKEGKETISGRVNDWNEDRETVAKRLLPMIGQQAARLIPNRRRVPLLRFRPSSPAGQS